MRLTCFAILSLSLTASLFGQTSAVVLGGAGSSPWLEATIDQIADALTADGGKVLVLSGHSEARTALLEQMKKSGNNSLLYVTLHDPRDNPKDTSRGDITAACFVNSRQVWEEKAKGPLIFAGSKDDAQQKTTEGVIKQIRSHAGGPCLTK